MDDEKGHGHGDDERNRGQTRRQTDNKQQSAEHLGEYGEIEAHGRTDAERIGKSLRHAGVFFHLRPTVQQEHGKSEPNTEHENTEIFQAISPAA